MIDRSLYLFVAFTASCFVVGDAAASDARIADVASTHLAVAKSLPYLAAEGDRWIEERKCATCHHTGLLIWSHRLARSRGIEVDQKRIDDWSTWMLEHELQPRDDVDGKPRPGPVAVGDLEGVAQLVLGGTYTAAVSRDDGKFLKGFAELHDWIVKGQQAEGKWKAGGQLPTQKRTALETDAASTAWAVLAMDVMPGSDAGARRRALNWLAGPGAVAEEKSTEWMALQVLLADRFKRASDIEAATKVLLEKQNADGGWAWLQGDPSDALATGQALFALSEIRRTASRYEAIERARKFLVSSQRDDGSWETKSTKEKSKTKSTDISNFFGTAWATIGLCRSLPES